MCSKQNSFFGSDLPQRVAAALTLDCSWRVGRGGEGGRRSSWSKQSYL